jgi:hypothetical protein
MEKKVEATEKWGWVRSGGMGGVGWGEIGSLVVAAAVILGVALMAYEGVAVPPQQRGGWAGVDAGGWEVALKALYVLLWPIMGASVALDARDAFASARVTRGGRARRLVVVASAAVSLALGLVSVPVVDLAGSALARRMGTGMSVLEARAGVVGSLTSVVLLMAYGALGAGRIEQWLREKELPGQLKYVVHAFAALACAGIYLVVTKVLTGILGAGAG